MILRLLRRYHIYLCTKIRYLSISYRGKQIELSKVYKTFTEVLCHHIISSDTKKDKLFITKFQPRCMDKTDAAVSELNISCPDVPNRIYQPNNFSIYLTDYFLSNKTRILRILAIKVKV